MKLLETSIFRLHFIDGYIDRASSTVDHHVPGTYHAIQSKFTRFNSKQSERMTYSTARCYNICLIFDFWTENTKRTNILEN